MKSGIFRIQSQICLGVNQRPLAILYTIPYPLVNTNQCPLIELTVIDKNNIDLSVSFSSDGLNTISRITIGPLKKGQKVKLRNNILVLLTNLPSHLSAKDKHDKWLCSTKCVQTDHPAILELAKRISKPNISPAHIVAKVLEEVKRIVQKPNRDTRGDQSAVSALSHKVNCVGESHLAAALLRASGIPARIIAGLPTSGIPFQVHFIVEYWNKKWMAIDPRVYSQDRGSLQDALDIRPTEIIRSRVVLPEDEENSDPRGIIGCRMPFLTGPEFGDLTIGMPVEQDTDSTQCDVLIYPMEKVTEFRGTSCLPLRIWEGGDWEIKAQSIARQFWSEISTGISKISNTAFEEFLSKVSRCQSGTEFIHFLEDCIHKKDK